MSGMLVQSWTRLTQVRFIRGLGWNLDQVTGQTYMIFRVKKIKWVFSIRISYFWLLSVTNSRFLSYVVYK